MERLSGGDGRGICAVFCHSWACQLTAQPCLQRDRDTQAQQNRPGHNTLLGQDGQEMQLPHERSREKTDLKSSYTQICQKYSCPRLRFCKQQRLAGPSNTYPLIFGYPALQRSQNIRCKATRVFLDCPSQRQDKKIYSHLLPPQAAPVLAAAVSSPSPRARNKEISTHQLSVFLAQCC